MKALTIRPWEERDREAVAALVAASTGDDPIARTHAAVHGPTCAAPGHVSRTLVACVGDLVVSAGTVWESWFHPARWRISLQVEPRHRRQGIGSAMLDALAAEAARHDDRGLQVGLSAAATESQEFLVNRGFRDLMRTRLGRLDPTHIPDSSWLRITDSARWRSGSQIPIRSFATFESRDDHSAGIADLHARIYRQTHAWSPPAPPDPEQALSAFLGDDLIPEALFIAFDGDRPIGVSSLRHGESAMEFDLGWTGVLTEFGPHIPDLTLALLGHCLSFAREAERSISIEVDAADDILWDLIDTLPVSYQPDWFNFERSGT